MDTLKMHTRQDKPKFQVNLLGMNSYWLTFCYLLRFRHLWVQNHNQRSLVQFEPSQVDLINFYRITITISWNQYSLLSFNISICMCWDIVCLLRCRITINFLVWNLTTFVAPALVESQSLFLLKSIRTCHPTLLIVGKSFVQSDAFQGAGAIVAMVTPQQRGVTIMQKITENHCILYDSRGSKINSITPFFSNLSSSCQFHQLDSWTWASLYAIKNELKEISKNIFACLGEEFYRKSCIEK